MKSFVWGERRSHAETELPNAAVRRSLQHRRTGGKSLFARIADTLLLFFVAFAAVFLYLAGKGIHIRHALLLACIAVLFVAVVYRIYCAAALQRFLPQEIDRLSREILQRKMPFWDDVQMSHLCKHVSGVPNPIVLHTAEPVGADLLLPYLCKKQEKELVFCASAGYTEMAKKLAAAQKHPVKLIGAEPLLDAAMQMESLRPSVQEVYEEIEAEEKKRKQRRRKVRAFPLGSNSRRYLIAAGLLLLFSFQTGYALYYRMLSSLCVGMSVLHMLLSRGVHKETPL